MSLASNQNVSPNLKNSRESILFGGLLWAGILLSLVFLFSLDTFAKGYSESEIQSVMTSKEKKIKDLSSQEVQQIRIALGRRLPTQRRADLYFRLAELYLEAYQMERLLEGKVHEKRISQGHKGRLNLTRSRPYLEKGIKACQDILNLKMQYKKQDHIYYFLAFNYGELGKRKTSLKYYRQLTEKFPNSVFAIEGYREMANDAYFKRKYRKSQALYEQAIKAKGGKTSASLYHRLAWSYYRTRQFNRTIETMKKAIELAKENKEKFVSVSEELLRDMAVFLTERGKVNEAVEYFEKVAGDKTFYPKVLEQLGKEYERKVQNKKAVAVYESLIKTQPNDEVSYRVQIKLIELDLRQFNFESVLGRLKNFEARYNGEDQTILAAKQLKSQIRNTATSRHDMFRKKGKKRDLLLAENFYEIYLSQFLAEGGKETAEIQMYLAEVKTEQSKYEAAAILYQKIIESDNTKYRQDASTLRVASLFSMLKKLSKKKKANSEAPSELEKEFVEAADKLGELKSTSSEARDAALKAAQLLAGYKITQLDAMARARVISENWPKTNHGLLAGRLWLQIVSDRLPQPKDSDPDEILEATSDAKKSVDRLMKNKALLALDARSGKKLAKQIEALERRLRVSTIAAHEKSENFGSAAQEYESFAKGAAQRKLAERAYSSAISAHMKNGDVEGVKRLIDVWIKRFPKSDSAIDRTRAASTEFFIRGKFSESAELFETLGTMASDSGALETAARIFEATLKTDQARKSYQTYITKYPKGEGRWRVIFAYAQIFESEGKESEAIKIYQSCLKGPSTVAAECACRLGDLYRRMKDSKRSKDYFWQASQKSGSTSPFVGYARYRLAEIIESERATVPLKQVPAEKMGAELAARLKFFEKLNRAYLKAVEAGGPWGIAALGQLAEWALNFAKEVDDLPAPSNMEESQADNYTASLEKLSRPLRKKAVQTLKEAYEKAVRGSVYAPALPSIADKIADQKLTYPFRAQGFRGHFQLAGISPHGGNKKPEEAIESARTKLLANRKASMAWIDYGNLLWGLNRPGLAKIAYERSLQIKSKNSPALNNLGVVEVTGRGQEDWVRVAEAVNLFNQAIKKNTVFLQAKINQALLMNYYRLFKQAKNGWLQVVVKWDTKDSQDGLAIALQGLGKISSAEAAFDKADKLGAPSNRFAKVFHLAAKLSVKGRDGADDCVDELDDLEDLKGFEEESSKRLEGVCRSWK